MKSRRDGNRGLALVRVLLALGLLTVGVAVAGYSWIQTALSPVEPDDSGATTLRFDVKPGDTMGRVAYALEKERLIRNARVARWFARSEDFASKLKVGEYELSRNQSTREILETLAKGRVRTHSVAIPEGLRATEIAQRLEGAGLADRDEFLAIVLDPSAAKARGIEAPTLEGYLFPDTYRFAKGVPAEQVVDAMVDEFKQVFEELEPAFSKQALSMHEFVTLASIVEKETGAPAERPLIAAVFLNRLKRGMRLETDPTVIYGIENYNGNIRKVHLLDETNPYNTYKISGLPPGPIASPGRDALTAVLNPADSPFLYFVSRNDGTHVFSRSYVEHERAVDEFQRRKRRR